MIEFDKGAWTHLVWATIWVTVQVCPLEAEAAEVEKARSDTKKPASWRVTNREPDVPYQVRIVAREVKNRAIAAAKRFAQTNGTRSESDEKSNSSDFNIRGFGGFSKLIPGYSKTRRIDLYRRDSAWLKGVEAIERDECDEADKKLSELRQTPWSKLPAPEKYVRARLEDCGENGSAQKLERLARRDQTKAGMLAGVHLGRMPDRDDATQTLYQIIRDIRRVARNGDLEKALSLTRQWLKRVESAWHRYQLKRARARLLRSEGKLERAGKKLLDLYREVRGWRVGGRVENKLEQLDERLSENLFPFGARVDRMRELIKRGRYEKARQVSVDNAEIRGVEGSEIRGWTYYRRALQAEAEQNRDKAVKLFKKAERLVSDDVIRPRLYFGWARALQRLDRDSKAIEMYDRVCREYPDNHLCDNSLFYRAKLQLYDKKFESALASFQKLNATHSKSPFVPYALWWTGFTQYLLDYNSAAIETLRIVRKQHDDITDDAGISLGLKAEYWLGRIHQKLGDRDRARAHYQQTLRRGTFSWYGTLAYSRMRRADMVSTIRWPYSFNHSNPIAILQRLPLPSNRRLDIGIKLVELGFFREGAERLDKQANLFPSIGKIKPVVAVLRRISGEQSPDYGDLERHLASAGPTYRTLPRWRAAYPKRYWSSARQFGDQWGVSPSLILAVVRKESRFRRQIKSPVGAVGLMQLMPGTANRVAREFLANSDWISRSELTDPKRNMRLGSLYLRAQIEMASGQIPVALANYNAGPGVTAGWLERYGDYELDSWVELITYSSVRAYIRRVYRNYIAYRALYTNKPFPTVRFDVPNSLRGADELVPEAQPDRPISELPSELSDRGVALKAPSVGSSNTFDP